MPWPSLEKNYRFVDWSYFQNHGYPEHTPFDVDAFCEEHPEVDGAIIRFCWPSGNVDKHYAHYYDGFTRNGKFVMGYGWPNPHHSVERVLNNWLSALGDRVPKVVWADWEESSVTEEVSKDAMTRHMMGLAEERVRRLPEVTHGEYSRASWLDVRVNPIDFVRSRLWWLAHWIILVTTDKQARNFAESDALLPVDNNFTPWRGSYVKIPIAQVKGWQISSKMLIVPRGTSDGGYMLKSFVDPIYNGTEPEPEPEKVVVTITTEVTQGDAEIIVKEL